MPHSPEIVFHADRYSIERVRRTGNDGRVHSRDIIRHPGAVVLLPITSDDRVVMIRNHRVSIGETLLELPAGTIERGDSPQETAARELIEETGYRAADLQLVRKFYASPGICDEAMYLFLARGLVAGEPDREVTEQIENQLATWDEIRNWLRDGTIQDGKTLVGLMSYLIGER
ncbi:NUDIX hydrolase [Candidatus Laterigemmans baculatus]|uniref:NUDIX hydrolase n=1 Tax=Candidatus Laterigemmans baculatus TaxID=2770505 RepID=UPI0013DD4DB2|nr:NUDIX hydrolase [Candidatus Laterigemmans baculatus]